MNFIKAYKTIKKYSSSCIIMLSEGAIYYNTNKPVIDELIKKTGVLYISMDKTDCLLSYKHNNFHPVCLDFDFWGRLLLAVIKGKLFITTTPSIDILTFKRSPNVKHYSYYMHSSTDIHYYQKNSFDYFDSVVCAGDFQIKPLNMLEQTRNTKVKEKIVLGIPYYDIYKPAVQNNAGGKYILIAPSWCSNNFLNYIDYDIFQLIFNYGYNIIYRPHPMSFIEEIEQIENITKKYSSGYNGLTFEIDDSNSPVDAINKSCALISAHSGMVIDYLVLTNKAVLFYNIERNTNNLEYSSLNMPSWDESIISENTLHIKSSDDVIYHLHNLHQYSRHTSINDIVNKGSAAHLIAEYYFNKYNGMV